MYTYIPKPPTPYYQCSKCKKLLNLKTDVVEIDDKYACMHCKTIIPPGWIAPRLTKTDKIIYAVLGIVLVLILFIFILFGEHPEWFY